jgi:hypothetical protein
VLVVRTTGIAVLIGAVVLAGLMILVWLLGLVFGFTAGGLIHLVLVLALLIAPVGIVTGVFIIILASRRTGQR